MRRTDVSHIQERIVVLRGRKVILASDLAAIYGVETRTLNQAVKRNKEKFPADFMFRLTRMEGQELQRSRSQIVTLKRGGNIKYLPYAFTEHGAIMAANVLNSKRAVQMSPASRDRSRIHQDAKPAHGQQRTCTQALGAGARTQETSRRPRDGHREHPAKDHGHYRSSGTAGAEEKAYRFRRGRIERYANND